MRNRLSQLCCRIDCHEFLSAVVATGNNYSLTRSRSSTILRSRANCSILEITLSPALLHQRFSTIRSCDSRQWNMYSYKAYLKKRYIREASHIMCQHKGKHGPFATKTFHKINKKLFCYRMHICDTTTYFLDTWIIWF